VGSGGRWFTSSPSSSAKPREPRAGHREQWRICLRGQAGVQTRAHCIAQSSRERPVCLLATLCLSVPETVSQAGRRHEECATRPVHPARAGPPVCLPEIHLGSHRNRNGGPEKAAEMGEKNENKTRSPKATASISRPGGVLLLVVVVVLLESRAICSLRWAEIHLASVESCARPATEASSPYGQAETLGR